MSIFRAAHRRLTMQSTVAWTIGIGGIVLALAGCTNTSMDRAALLDRPPDVECIVEKVRRTEGIVRVEHFVQKGGRRLKGWRLGQPSTVHDIRWSSKDGFGQIIIRLDIDGGPDRYTYYQTIYGYHEVLTQQSVDTRPVDTRRPFALAIERNIRTACGVEELAHVKETCIGVRCI